MPVEGDLTRHIRAIADFPEPGVTFRDITPLLRDPEALGRAIEAMATPYLRTSLDAVVGMEARGFIFGSLLAQRLQTGFVPLRKPGKLPHDTHSVSYDLEYGTASLEVHTDAVAPGEAVLLVDDVLATGGTAEASIRLIERLRGRVVGCMFLIEIAGLGGRTRLADHDVRSLIQY